MMPVHPTDLLEAYALQLLSPTTEAEVAAHLAICDTCQEEVTSLTATLGMLAYAAPAHKPSAQGEDRLLARIAALRQQEQSPADAQEESVAASASASATPPATLHPSPATGGYISAWRSRRWVTALGTVAAALVVVVLVAALLAQHSGTPPSPSLTDQAIQALHATHPQTFTLKATVAGPKDATAVMAMDPTQGRGVLVVAHLPSPPAGKIYQFWLLQSAGAGKPTTTMSAGTFDVQADGSGEYFFTSSQPIDTLTNAGVSLERAGGVASPDSPMLLLIND